MVTSQNPASLYWQLMAIYLAAEKARHSGPLPSTKQMDRSKRGDASPRNVFALAAAAGAVLSPDAPDGESLTPALVALLSEILTQIGAHGYMPTDLKNELGALVDDFEAQAPKVASRLRAQLKGA